MDNSYPIRDRDIKKDVFMIACLWKEQGEKLIERAKTQKSKSRLFTDDNVDQKAYALSMLATLIVFRSKNLEMRVEAMFDRQLLEAVAARSGMFKDAAYGERREAIRGCYARLMEDLQLSFSGSVVVYIKEHIRDE